MAQKGVNKVIILGTLGRDPEVKTFNNGGMICNLALATNESWIDKNTNQKQEKTEWHRVSVKGKLAEIAAKYLKKGSQAYFEGKLETRSWENQQGQKQYSTEIVVDGFSGVMQMLGGNNNQSSANHNNNTQSKPVQQAPQDMSDDIPF